MEASLVSSLVHCSAICWSQDNLLAVSAGHLITIFDPSNLHGPRGYIKCKVGTFLGIGNVSRSDSSIFMLLPDRLERDVRPCVRSVAWSPQGLSSHGGCFLAVVTADGRISLYRAPVLEYQAEWVEALDLSRLMFESHRANMFSSICLEPISEDGKSVEGDLSLDFRRKAEAGKELNVEDVPELFLDMEEDGLNDVQKPKARKRGRPSVDSRKKDIEEGNAKEQRNFIVTALCEKFEQKRNARHPEKLPPYSSRARISGVDKSCLDESIAEVVEEYADTMASLGFLEKELVRIARVKIRQILTQYNEEQSSDLLPASTEAGGTQQKQGLPAPSSLLPKSGAGFVTGQEWCQRKDLVTQMATSWSPLVQVPGLCGGSFLAVGSRSGHVTLWFVSQWSDPEAEQPAGLIEGHSVISVLEAKCHDDWVTAFSWAAAERDCDSGSANPLLLLLSGCVNGSVKLWSLRLKKEEGAVSVWSLGLVSQLFPTDRSLVTVVALSVSASLSVDFKARAAVGKAGGQLSVADFSLSAVDGPVTISGQVQITCSDSAHCQIITGLACNQDTGFIYSCSQDNQLIGWTVTPGSALLPHQIPLTPLVGKSDVQTEDLSQSMDCYLGLALSPNGLVLASVRGVSDNVVDKMYLKRTTKGCVQLNWIVSHVSEDLTAGDHSSFLVVPPKISVLSPYPEAVPWSAWSARLEQVLHMFVRGGRPSMLWDVKQAFKVSSTAIDGLQLLLSEYCVPSLGPDGLPDAYLSEASTAKLQSLNCLIRAMQLAPHAEFEGSDGAQGFVDRVEEELRQRFFLAALTLAANTGQWKEEMLLPAHWVVHNEASVWPALLEAARSTLSSQDNPNGEHESCIFCHARTELMLVEWAECGGASESSAKHKLQRCMRTLKAGGHFSDWRCAVCKRRAADSRGRFLCLTGASTRASILTGEVCWKQSHFPTCIFCGVPLQKLLPAILPVPNLV